MSNVRVSDFRANLGRVEREGSPSVLGRLYFELRKVIRSQTHKIWSKRVSNQRNSRYKGLEMELSVACLRNRTEPRKCWKIVTKEGRVQNAIC